MVWAALGGDQAAPAANDRVKPQKFYTSARLARAVANEGVVIAGFTRRETADAFLRTYRGESEHVLALKSLWRAGYETVDDYDLTQFKGLFSEIEDPSDGSKLWTRPIDKFPPIEASADARIPFSRMGFGTIAPAKDAISVADWETTFASFEHLRTQVRMLIAFCNGILDHSSDEHAARLVRALQPTEPKGDGEFVNVSTAVEMVDAFAKDASEFLNACSKVSTWDRFSTWATAVAGEDDEQPSADVVRSAYELYALGRKSQSTPDLDALFVSDKLDLHRWRWAETFQAGVQCEAGNKHPAVRALMLKECRRSPRSSFPDINRMAGLVDAVLRDADPDQKLQTDRLTVAIEEAMRKVLLLARPEEPTKHHASILDAAMADVEAASPSDLAGYYTLIKKALEATQRVHRVKVMINLRTEGGPWDEARVLKAKRTADAIAGAGARGKTQLSNLSFDGSSFGPFFAVSSSGIDVGDQVERDMESLAETLDKEGDDVAVPHHVYTAYGLSGSGKTHTLLQSDTGFMKMIVRELKSMMSRHPDTARLKFGVKDIYGEVSGTGGSGDADSRDFDDKCIAAYGAEPAEGVNVRLTTTWTRNSRTGVWSHRDYTPQGSEKADSYMSNISGPDELDALPSWLTDLVAEKKKTNLRPEGLHRYHVRATPNNRDSSRAHTVIRFVLTHLDGEVLGKVTLIDMAGAEDVDALQREYFKKVRMEMIKVDSRRLDISGITASLINDPLTKDPNKPIDVSDIRQALDRKSNAVKITTENKLYDVANVESWMKLRDSLTSDADKQDCDRVMSCPPQTENIVDLVWTYLDMLDAKCYVMQVLMALTVKSPNKVPRFQSQWMLRYFPEKVRMKDDRSMHFGSFWKTINQINNTHKDGGKDVSVPGKVRPEDQLKADFKLVSTGKPTKEVLFQAYKERPQSKPEKPIFKSTSPGCIYARVRSALVEGSLEAEHIVKLKEIVSYTSNGRSLSEDYCTKDKESQGESLFQKLDEAMQAIMLCLHKALSGIHGYELGEDAISPVILNMLEYVTGRRWGGTITDFETTIQQNCPLAEPDGSKPSQETLAKTQKWLSGTVRSKLSQVYVVIAEHKRAMAKVHCPIRFQGKYIMETLEDLKALASDLSSDVKRDPQGWLASALKDPGLDGSTEDLRLTQVVAIRTDFSLQPKDEEGLRLREGACQSLQFAASVNPLIQSKPALKCTPADTNPAPVVADPERA